MTLQKPGLTSPATAGPHQGGERPRGIRVHLQATVKDQDLRAGVRGGVREVQRPRPYAEAGRPRHVGQRQQGLHDVFHGERYRG